MSGIRGGVRERATQPADPHGRPADGDGRCRPTAAAPRKTPHIDRLAAEGVVFEPFYCNSPLCAPSRFSMLSGRLPSAIGAYDNAAEFRADVPTFAHYLRRAGYRPCSPARCTSAVRTSCTASRSD